MMGRGDATFNVNARNSASKSNKPTNRDWDTMSIFGRTVRSTSGDMCNSRSIGGITFGCSDGGAT